MGQAPHILIVGGGYAGMHTAVRLRRRLRSGEGTVTVVDPRPAMTYQPFLAALAAGTVEPRHVAVPLREVLDGCRVLTAEVTAVDHARRTATVTPADGDPVEVRYDILVLTAGSTAGALPGSAPIPGLATSGLALATAGDAIRLRSQVLSRLDLAAATADGWRRRKALRFVVVGGGYAGVTAVAELPDLARHAVQRYPELWPEDLRWVLVEAGERILPEAGAALAGYAERHLLGRGIEVRCRTRVASMVNGHVVLTDGHELDADTVLWTAAAKANPLAARSGLPVRSDGRLVCTAELRINGVEDAWAAGDCAAVPDLAAGGDPDGYCTADAHHAHRQAKRLADNIVAVLRGKQPKPYLHRRPGVVVGLGLHQGVAELRGGGLLRGWPAWFLYRVHHLRLMPTAGRKLRLLADWTVAMFFRRDVVSLGRTERRTEVPALERVWPAEAARNDPVDLFGTRRSWV